MSTPIDTTDAPEATVDSLARVSEQVASIRSRREKLRLLAACFVSYDIADLQLAVTYLTGQLPQGRIGVGAAALRKAWQELDVHGEHSPPGDMPLRELDSRLTQLAHLSGPGTERRRHEQLIDMLGTISETSRKFVSKLILGELRQGALESLVTDALAQAAEVPVPTVRRAVMLTGDVSEVASIAHREGQAGLQRIGMQLFRPVQPMLAEPVDDETQAIEKLGTAALEYKLDGVRVQVHKQGDEVRIFTRHLNEITHNAPEIVQLVRHLPTNELVLDGEVLAIRPDGRPFAFQTTMRRFGRERGINLMARELPLSVYFFDILRANDETLIDQSTATRHQALADCVPTTAIIPRTITNDPAVATQFLKGAMEAGHEGLMAKSLDVPYEAGGRGGSWLKIKPSHSLDVVILAAEWGSGRREGWLSNLHLGVRDTESGQFAMVGKTFKGLTDDMLRWQTEQLLAIESHREGHTVFVRPQLIAEVALNDVQKSSRYAAGFALRFARIKRYRHDKTVDQIDTLRTVAAIHAARAN